MNKSILLTGGPGSGKTRKAYDLLTDLARSTWTRMHLCTFEAAYKPDLKKQYDVIFIDEVYPVKKLDYLIDVMNSFDLKIIVEIQVDTKEIDDSVLSSFEHIECVDSRAYQP